MRRGLFLFAGILSVTALSHAQQVVVREPNGAERWKKGDTHEIKWGCVQCTGTAELYLVRVTQRNIPGGIAAMRSGYHTLGVIKTAIAVNPSNPFYSHSWRVGDYVGGTVPPGDGYMILVKVVSSNGTVSDTGDSGFVIGGAAISYFGINDGLAVTEQRRVTLNYRFSGFPAPNRYRVRTSQGAGTPQTMSSWLPLPAGSWPVHELPDRPGDYTVGLALANEFGESPMVDDTIRYAPPAPLKDYTIQAATLVCGGFPDMDPAWYSCRCTSVTMSTLPPSAEDCSCTSTGVVVVRTKAVGLGTKVEYEFFGGRQLNEGWSFVSLSYSDAACREHAGHAVLIMPQAGSRNILFKVRLWTEGIRGGLTATLSACEFHIHSLVIRGPSDRPVSEAFK